MKQIVTVEPVLRWVGGKSWFVKNFTSSIGRLDFNNYHEPFVGGASAFLAFGHGHQSHLSDLNAELIETYRAIKKNPKRVLQYLQKYKNEEKCYYDARASRPRDIYSRSARFIYLNQTSYNGIYRVNSRGEYNVPYGFRTKNFVEKEKVYRFSERLQSAELNVSDFAMIIDKVSMNDLVFLDPPYTVSHNKNGFIKYNQKLFSLDDQYRLYECVQEIKLRKAFYILTNAAHDVIRNIFTTNDNFHEVERSSLIGGKKAVRGRVSEFIFTNVDLGI